jgi:hypothetical protein
MIVSEKRHPTRIKSGAGFFRAMHFVRAVLFFRAVL